MTTPKIGCGGLMITPGIGCGGLMTTPRIGCGGLMITPMTGGLFITTPMIGCLIMTPMTGLADALVGANAVVATVATAAMARIEQRVNTGYLLTGWINPSGHSSSRDAARFRLKTPGKPLSRRM